MERKAHNSLTEAALQVQLGDTQEPEINEVDPMVLEYFNNYFDGDLNEDTFEEDILEAVDALVELCADVCDAVGLAEKNIIKPKQTVVRHPGKRSGATIKRGDGAPNTFVHPKYADSKTKIRTLKIPRGAKIERPQITPKIDASQLPVVGPGQPDYHQM